MTVPSPLRPASPATLGRIAVLCHIYHSEFAVEIRSYLRNIPFPFDLYISTDNAVKKDRISHVFGDWAAGKLDVRVLLNRGRDIAPKLVGLRDVHRHYDYVLHLHSKRSRATAAVKEWRGYLFSTLIGSPEIVRTIFGIFAASDRIGIVAPQHYEPVRRWCDWAGNFTAASELARRMGVTLDPRTALDFPSGSMFWARTAALKPLLDLPLTLDDFAEEANQSDGTLAHAIERLFFYSCERANLDWVKVGIPEFFRSDVTFETAETPQDVTAFIDRRQVRLIDGNAPVADLPFAAVDETPRALVTRLQDHALGRDDPAEVTSSVAVGIVTYNNDAEQLRRLVSSALVALNSLGGGPRGTVWLLDNGNRSQLPSELEMHVRRLESGGNVGFGAAHNAIMRAAFAHGADLYVATNPDGMLHPDAIAAMAVRLRRPTAARSWKPASSPWIIRKPSTKSTCGPSGLQLRACRYLARCTSRSADSTRRSSCIAKTLTCRGAFGLTASMSSSSLRDVLAPGDESQSQPRDDAAHLRIRTCPCTKMEVAAVRKKGHCGDPVIGFRPLFGFSGPGRRRLARCFQLRS